MLRIGACCVADKSLADSTNHRTAGNPRWLLDAAALMHTPCLVPARTDDFETGYKFTTLHIWQVAGHIYHCAAMLLSIH
jgi:hypothetical protein